MSDFSPTAILIPSLNRPQRLEATLENIQATTPEPYRIVWCVGDPESVEILDTLGEAFLNDSEAEDKRYVTRMNKLIHYIEDAQSVFYGSDDIVFHEGWLGHALKVMDEGYAVVVVDDMHNPNGTQALMKRDYLAYACFDDPTVVFHPEYGHNFADNEQFFTAQYHGVIARAMDAKVEHLHPLFGSANALAWDTTYTDAQVLYARDKARFESRMQALHELVMAQ